MRTCDIPLHPATDSADLQRAPALHMVNAAAGGAHVSLLLVGELGLAEWTVHRTGGTIVFPGTVGTGLAPPFGAGWKASGVANGGGGVEGNATVDPGVGVGTKGAAAPDGAVFGTWSGADALSSSCGPGIRSNGSAIGQRFV